MATTAHPGNDYYVYTLTGTIQRQSNSILATGLKASGWAGPYTWAQAQQVLASGQTAKQAVTGAIPGVTDIGDFFYRLTQKATWERAGEILAGVILLYAGVKAMTGIDPVKSVVTTGRKIVK